MSIFNKFKQKKEGAIRYYDLASPGVKTACILIFVICLIFAVMALFPAVWVCLASLKNIQQFRRNPTILPDTYDFSVFAETWNRLEFLKYYVNSFISVIGGTVCAVVFNGLLAYGLGILKPKGYRIVNGLVMWCLLIPATTSMVALFVNINNVGLSGSFLPLWLSMGANAFYVILFKQYFEGLPKSLLEAATLDGCSDFRAFFRIVLPLSKPIVMVICIFAVTYAWSDFLLPFLILSGTETKTTVMVRLFQYHTSSANDVEVLRAIVFSMIPPVIIFALFQKQITQSVASAGIKG